MHLVGQHSNPSELLEAVLDRDFGASWAGRTESPAPPAEAKRLGNGVVRRAVVKALAKSAGPMGVCEAQAAVEGLLGHGVSRDSVNSCLSTGARGAQPNFQRVAPGRYQLKRAP